MAVHQTREIPYNYTSADDAQVVRFLFGRSTWHLIEKIRFQKKTGRLLRSLLSFIGDIFILRRNPFLFHELIIDHRRQHELLSRLKAGLKNIEPKATGNPEIQPVYSRFMECLESLTLELKEAHRMQERIRTTLTPIVGKENIGFDPFTITSHITDATDWRLYPPVAVVWPDKESQVPKLLTAIRKLELHAIPRGAGTGLTGGAVPAAKHCIMVNTEKMNRILGLEEPEEPERGGLPVLSLEAGVITGDAMKFAEKKGYVFATDPTSAWACTIGGNIAENAGGKTAVLWGTAIDNLYSFRIASPDGRLLEVQRIAHPLRKILPDDQIQFQVVDLATRETLQNIDLAGTEIRTKGLGKDITNKALNGLPGIQKEGTDGVITSAKFILHKAYAYKSTCCIEFFGQDMDEAGRIILEISRTFVNRGEETLMALEHFDEEYVRAIQYKVKAPRSESPKAVLLIDIVGHTKEQLRTGKTRLSNLLTPYANSFAFFTESKTESERFWQDRKKLGAIARRTNAFKLNEDIVLPLSALPEFSNFVDRCNIEEERENQQSFAWQVSTYLEDAEPLADPDWLEAKIPAAKKLLRDTLVKLSIAGKHHLQQETHTRALQNDLMVLFSGFSKVCGEINTLYQETRSVRIVIATHMHAGDGNVHVNIPVFSNDREMMIRAMETADAVMEKAVELGGVVSGEHGIGFTKLKYIDPEQIERLNRYRKKIDPYGVMNPDKLSNMEIPGLVFTPSFNLLDLEARIMRHGSLRDLAAQISNCVRCGRCKTECCVFYPMQNLFFHPRNKNLAIAALIEASLYEAQKFRSTRFVFLKHLEEIADHCTICHKCFAPCPVNIDTGDVSIMERQILSIRKQKHTAAATRLSLRYLESRSRLFNIVFRNLVVGFGGSIQRNLSKFLALQTQVIGKNLLPAPELLSSPIPPSGPDNFWRTLPECENHQALLITPGPKWDQVVFYFPGCGSERLFAQIGKAAVYLLLKTNTAVVLPPPFLCCGFPAKVNAKTEMESRIALRNFILLSQIQEVFSHLTFDAIVVSCGTCREALAAQQVDAIFHAKLLDVSLFARRLGISLQPARDQFYHQPCHDSLDGNAMHLLADAGKGCLHQIPGCCAEAGTMALSRPDITAAMRTRKEGVVLNAKKKSDQKTTILTNCPSCIQGLGRHSKHNVQARHIAVEMALQVGGTSWEAELRTLSSNAERIHF